MDIITIICLMVGGIFAIYVYMIELRLIADFVLTKKITHIGNGSEEDAIRMIEKLIKKRKEQLRIENNENGNKGGMYQ